MSIQEINEIKAQIAKNNEMREANHKEVMEVLQALKEQVAPVCDLYVKAKNYGSVTYWLAKYIATPIIIFLGALLTYKNLTK